MAYIKFDHTKTQKRTLVGIEMVKSVLDDLFKCQGFRLSVRQVFYALVAQGLVENSDKGSRFVEARAAAGRMRGLLDWDAIEDRLREVILPYYFDSIESGFQSLLEGYRLDRQMDQHFRIEIWVEKDAVSQIIEPVAEEYGIPFLCGRGQFSISCLKESADRWRADGRPVQVLYFGDHDPSGIFSIEENIRNKMRMMCPDVEQEIIRVAVPLGNLSMLKLLPPNKVKEKDRNTKKYRATYGEKCWELEALTPKVLVQLLHKELRQWINFPIYHDIRKQEEVDREELERLIKRTRP